MKGGGFVLKRKKERSLQGDGGEGGGGEGVKKPPNLCERNN